MKNAIFNLTGATCASCAYTIEHIGRKTKGIKNIKVDVKESKINLEYDGSPDIINKIIDMVDKLGYEATLAE